MILVDTSVLIGFFKGSRSEAASKFKFILQQGLQFGITSHIFQEVLQGAKSEKEYRVLRRYLETQRFFHPKDPVISFAEAARIFFLCRKRGVTIRSTIDCLIGQIALEHELPLLHGDNDFDMMAKIIPLKIY
ncbi:MAG: PIN domain nuclease [Deltaproteobacteria bacterium]|nr:PIN domain nuclease [Deltaproteobacteria bacterium]